MDYLSPLIGTLTGVEMARWSDIFVFAFKAILFSAPFAVLGLLAEKDVLHAGRPVVVVKILIAFAFTIPVFIFAALNFSAPFFSDPFLETHPWLTDLWIMKGPRAPLLLAGLALLYFLVYVLETATGDLSK